MNAPQCGLRVTRSPLIPAQAGIQSHLPAILGPLSSQTKCNTFLGRCCNGAQIPAAVIGEPMRDCPTSGRRVLDPANRGSSGSRRSEEHTSELQSHSDLVCRLLL